MVAIEAAAHGYLRLPLPPAAVADGQSGYQVEKNN